MPGFSDKDHSSPIPEEELAALLALSTLYDTVKEVGDKFAAGFEHPDFHAQSFPIHFGLENTTTTVHFMPKISNTPAAPQLFIDTDLHGSCNTVQVEYSAQRHGPRTQRTYSFDNNTFVQRTGSNEIAEPIKPIPPEQAEWLNSQLVEFSGAMEERTSSPSHIGRLLKGFRK